MHGAARCGTWGDGALPQQTRDTDHAQAFQVVPKRPVLPLSSLGVCDVRGWKHFENSTSQFTHRFLNFKNPWRRM